MILSQTVLLFKSIMLFIFFLLASLVFLCWLQYNIVNMIKLCGSDRAMRT